MKVPKELSVVMSPKTGTNITIVCVETGAFVGKYPLFDIET
jgi:hypothetical protein